jgi:hypothetical protein
MPTSNPDPTRPAPGDTTGQPDAARTDLSHLHPDNLRLGSIGVFAGDWAWITYPTDPPRIPVGFVGLLIDVWNGWAVFACTRDVAQAIVADQERIRSAHRDALVAQGVYGPELTAQLDATMGRLRFDGDDIILDERAMYDGDPTARSRITPRPDGRYVIGGWSWCWTAVDPADCDRIAGQLPSTGAHQEFVVLTHTPDLTVPHHRLHVTSLARMPTHHGVAFTADLTLDGRYVGTIASNGRSTEYRTRTSSPFNRRHLQQFVAGSRRRGQPATTEEVLRTLVDEYDMNRAVQRAQRDGTVLVRLLDRHGYPLAVLVTAAALAADRAALVRWLTVNHADPLGAQWVIWSGTGWRHLARIPTSTNPTPGS